MLRCVLLIVIDCLRADHVSCYGYHRPTTPTMDALAQRGILWEQAHAASSWTKPSVTSMLTGLYPTQHGAFLGIKRSKGRLAVTTDVLRSPRPTLAERFTNSGWRCAAFINNAQLGEFTGLNRGFERYVPGAGKADHLIGLFLDWLKEDLEKPAFVYLHFLEAHWPYKPRRRHIAMFGGDRDTNHFRDFSARDFGRLRRDIARRKLTLPDDHLEQLIQMYDGAVRRLDGKVKRILAGITELGLNDQTATIVTADHGEELLEHGQIGHGQSLYNELTHVPLIACIPKTAAGTRLPGPVSLVDLPQTLLSAAGLTGEPVGRNLLESGHANSCIYGELSIRRRYTQTIRAKEWKLHRRYKFEPPPGQTEIALPPWESVSTCPHEIKIELYNMESDRHEQTDLADDPRYAQVRADLLANLEHWWQEIATSSQAGTEHSEEEGTSAEHLPSEVELDSRVVQRLRDLGYLE